MYFLPSSMQQEIQMKMELPNLQLYSSQKERLSSYPSAYLQCYCYPGFWIICQSWFINADRWMSIRYEAYHSNFPFGILQFADK